MAKNPAYLPAHVWTVAGLIDAQERVIWSCRKCGAWAQADLLAIQRAKGPDYSLVDRTSRCRVEGCGGTVGFHYGSPARPLKALRERQAAIQGQKEREEMARAKAAYNEVARRLKFPPLP
ncbi:hypothetical protein CSW59_06990 [Caulobacter sp. BP25]|nr:hypothetical protein CSW59_06990 [Caulobacter sp. BP25]